MFRGTILLDLFKMVIGRTMRKVILVAEEVLNGGRYERLR